MSEYNSGYMAFDAKRSNVWNLESNILSLNYKFCLRKITFNTLADIELNILSSDSLHTSFETPAIKAISTYVILVRGIAPLMPLTSVGLIPD